MEHSAHTNRLIREKSPYLLQHAHNPVDWYAWGEDAFEKARRENKPIFLSIGYSTCHWCHVMERESFENEAIAAVLNRWFVAVKVDREERPDVDRLYMSAMQAMGSGGGWPLNVFLTPDLEPFFGGTYFPPDSTHGRPGLLQLLPRIHEAWDSQHDQLVASGRQVLAALGSMHAPDPTTVERARLIEDAFAALETIEDHERGGFGRAPKFPSISNLNFLMRAWARDPAGHAEARAMVERQLDAMREGGIHDHLGGGFHRYSTDRDWLVPHFEKMLYDQAQIAWSYLEGFQATGRSEYAETARGVFAYVARDLTAPGGAFYSAEDADSEGEEGKFYAWTPDQIEAVLGKADADLFAYRYGVTPEGNFEHHTSILHEVHTLAETARHSELSAQQAATRLAAAREKLLATRSKRVRPHRDDKVLTSWNGLMISAFARGARVLDDPELAARAERAAAFVWKELFDERTGELLRRWRDGEAAAAGQLDDYAYYSLGLIDLYGATFDPRWLERAVRVTQAQIDRFWDEEHGGFFESPAGDPSIKVRMKSDYDGAEMAGNSIAAWNLLTLAGLLDREDWRGRARRTLDAFAGRIARNPAAMPQMLVSADREISTARHIVIAGARGGDDTRAMVREFNRRFLPNDELLLVEGGESGKRLVALVPFTAAFALEGGKATAYVCVNYACRLPVTDRAAFAARLDERPRTPVAGGTR